MSFGRALPQVLPEDSSLVAMFGGSIGERDLDEFLPRDTRNAVVETICLCADYYSAMLASAGSPVTAGVYLAKSISMGCVARLSTKARRATVVIPVGVIARLRIMARLLLQYWDRERKHILINSPLDDIEPNEWWVPPRLAALLDARYGNVSTFWSELEGLDHSLELADEAEGDVRELLHLAIVHLLGHEFAHISHKHFEFEMAAQNDGFLQRYHLSSADVQKGIELHADVLAGVDSARVLLGQLRVSSAESDTYGTGFLRLSYMMTMLYSLYDPQHKFVNAYDEKRHSHPLIRWALASDAVREPIVALRGTTLAETWDDAELEGWNRCTLALMNLNEDVMLGRYGEIVPEKLIFPVHASPGGPASGLVLDEMVHRARALLDRFTAALSAEFE